jgi:LuxR family maltose regulon positive regulatory protein
MSTKTLTTKLFIPPIRKGYVHRQRLTNRLNQGVDGKLTLVSGPAGFGKTALLSNWVSGVKRPVGWISLDVGDNDKDRFSLYLIKAFQKISDGFANEVLEMLYSAKPLTSDVFLPYFIHQITEIQEPFLIVLDDYHVITKPEIHDLILTILENQPQKMHLVISTRSDPPWPLARWRAQGELSEIRTQDLRFILNETSTFLNEEMKTNLSTEDIKRLDDRTEGWVAGLQMAALSMQKQDDLPGFIQRFTGSHRFVFDYLIDEVFEGLSQENREFLLKTSTLDRMCAQLCDYLRDQNVCQQILDQLDQMNLFVIPLDDHRSWYRYHYLFRELLGQILKQTYPEQIPELHRKAREWYQCNGLIGDAIHHGMAEGDMEQVADLIEKNIFEALELRDQNLLTRWLENLPAEIIHSSPWLNIAYARLAITTGSPNDVAAHLQNAEISLEKRTGLEPIQEQHIRSYIASIRANLSITAGEIEKSIDYARQALQLLPQKDKLMRCLVASTLGTSLQRCGYFEEAAQAFTSGINAGRAIGDSNAVISLYGDLIGLYVEQGQLRQGYEQCRRAIQYIERGYQKRGRYTPGAAHIHFRMSTILRHWNDLDGSLQHARFCDEILDKWGLRYRLNFVNLAIALHAVGDFPEAHRTLREAELVAKQDSTFWLEDVKATQVLFWLVEGNLKAATRWALEREWDIDGEIDYQNQLLYRTLVHVRLAQGQGGDDSALEEGIHLLPRLMRLYKSSGATAYLIQSLILQTLAFQSKGYQDRALKSLKRAISLGEVGGYIRVFVREGESMEKLLRIANVQGEGTPYIQKLLSAFDSVRSENIESSLGSLTESLTDRELDVLRCLDSDMTIPEMANSLVISIETVRTHIKRIYRKLDVHSRFEAITKAKKLQLI